MFWKSRIADWGTRGGKPLKKKFFFSSLKTYTLKHRLPPFVIRNTVSLASCLRKGKDFLSFKVKVIHVKEAPFSPPFPSQLQHLTSVCCETRVSWPCDLQHHKFQFSFGIQVTTRCRGRAVANCLLNARGRFHSSFKRLLLNFSSLFIKKKKKGNGILFKLAKTD